MTTATRTDPLTVIPPAALALLAEIYGSGGICQSCGAGIKRRRRCGRCGARASLAVTLPPGSPPPPGFPCHHCRKPSPKRTRNYCPRCYLLNSRLEDYNFALAAGDSPETAAERIGVNLRTLSRHQAEWEESRPNP